jgi:hypothetical protein
MDDSNQPAEFSESGSPVYRHKSREKPFEHVFGNAEHIKAIGLHLDKHLGPPGLVFHELVSDLVHIDIHTVPSRPDRNFQTLITSGMSERAMKTPAGAEEWAYAELMICLPPEWRMCQEDFKDENNYWPIRLLKMLARFPHEYDTWLGVFHTVPYGNPGEPMASKNRFTGAILAPPVLAPEEFWRFQVHPELTINFLAVIPLYAEEMEFKLKHGAEALFERFDAANVTELVDINRKNVVKKKFLGLF